MKRERVWGAGRLGLWARSKLWVNLRWLSIYIMLRLPRFAPGLFLTVFLGFAPILYGLSRAVLEGRDPSPLSGLVDLFAIAFSISIASAAGWYVTYVAIPADRLAQAVVEGQNERTIVLYTSTRIVKLCRRFLRKVERSRAVIDALRVATEEGDRERLPSVRRITKCISRFDKLLDRQHKDRRRIEVIKLAAAREFQVHERRLCDHVFQFSPVIFGDHFWRYLGNWREIRREAEQGNFANIGKLLDQNDDLERKCRRRIYYQSQLQSFSDLHADIIRCSSDLSASQSLLEYARTLETISRRCLGRRPPSPRQI